MEKVNYLRLSVFLIILMTASSCYKEIELRLDSGDLFELTVSSEMQEFIYNSRDTSYTINEPGMAFLLDDNPLDLKEIYVRGQNALQYQRKSFGVKLYSPITLYRRNGSEQKRLSRFKLISMAMDYTYIENRIAFGILEDQGLMPLFYRYIELEINGATQGVYLLIEDPEQYYAEQGSEYILRRGYHGEITDSDYKVSFYNTPREAYEKRFHEIYSNLTLLHGEELYNALNDRMDMEQYFRKMGIDYLLQNGDYSDELYLYAMRQKEEICFKAIPWDYDDLFSTYPHEVGRAWAVGKLFGQRIYDTYQDVLDETGDKLIFSIEDDLDYVIASDPYLYAQYERTLADMTEQMNPEDFDGLFEEIKEELTPFYNNAAVVSQSQYDRNETSLDLWNANMDVRKTFLKERLVLMKDQLKDI